ncbi:hypothetical protein [Halococcus hamelinensis]|uniref:hypothetical protein n=1 Tax=Halococcus hamelinensis TaxID=332168 RepID=UPI000A48EFFD|nr:hypothetical protein [Halococcus hamelinensis]
MGLSKADREAVEELVQTLEDAGADVGSVKKTRWDDDDPIDLDISCELDPAEFHE